MRTTSIERFFDTDARGKFGEPYRYGERRFGKGKYGLQEKTFGYNGYGVGTYGKLIYGSNNERWGVYRKRGKGKTAYISRERFMWPKNPRTETQQNWRQVFKDMVIAWKALTPEQKADWNKKATNLIYTGYCLFTKWYLDSHK